MGPSSDSDAGRPATTSRDPLRSNHPITSPARSGRDSSPVRLRFARGRRHEGADNVDGGPEEIRVLQVDDDPAFGDTVAAFLEREDDRFVVTAATTADEGLDYLATNEVDCIVSDYDMPRTDGLAFLEAVREMNEHLPLILFTGKGSEEVASEAISAGITDYLRKRSGTDQYRILANRIRNAVESMRAKRARQRQREAIETAREGISVLDENGRFTYVNRAYADIYGYDPEELIGNHWEMVYPDDDVRHAHENIGSIMDERGYWHGVTTGLRADGSTFIEDHTLATAEHGEFVCTVRDVTDQKERERAFERTDALLSTLFDTLPAGVLAEDGSRTVMAVNRRLFDVPGEPDEAIGADCERMAEDASELAVDFPLLLASVAIAAAAGFVLVLVVGDRYLRLIGAIDHRRLCVAVLCLLVDLSYLFAGVVGIAVFA